MDNKPILYGIIGLLLGVGIATYAAQTAVNTDNTGMMRMMGMRGTASVTDDAARMMGRDMMDMGSSMDDMMVSMQGKTGDEFDKAFIASMTVHHEGAIEMAKEALRSAKHAELKMLAQEIITAQTTEITRMAEWAQTWGY